MASGDRIKENASVSGNGSTVTLSGAVASYQPFSSVFTNGQTGTIGILNLTTGEWEICTATYNSGPNTLTRGAVKTSSNSNGTVTFSAGTFVVFNTQSATEFSTTGSTGKIPVGVSGALDPTWLPAPTTTTLGGLQSLASATSHNYLTYIDSSGVQHLAQPSTADLSDGITGTGTVVLSNAPTLVNPVVGTQTFTDNSTLAASTAFVTTAINSVLANQTNKASCDYVAATALPTNTYSSNVLTATSNGALTVDSVTVALNKSILVVGESTASHNGIFTVTATGDSTHPYTLTRRADYNSSAEIQTGDIVFVASGTTYAKTTWVMYTAGTITLDSSSLSWTQIAGPGTYVNGTGLTLTGSIFSVNASQTQITAVGTIGTGVWQGTKVGLAYGGTNADLSATGGTSQVLKQTSSGGAVTVAQLGLSDLSTIGAYTYVGNSTSGSASPASNTVLTLGTPSGTLTPTAGTVLGQLTGNTNNYSQLMLQNLNSGSSASGDLVITADTGTDSTKYFDMGINNSTGGLTPFSNALACYLYTDQPELNIGALGTSGVVNIYASGGTTTPTKAIAISGTSSTFSGQIVTALAGAASAPAVSITGTPFAGTGTTSYPLMYLNQSTATATTTLNTAGTFLGINSHGTADFVNFMKDGASKFSVDYNGNVTATEYYVGTAIGMYNYGVGVMIAAGGSGTYGLYLGSGAAQMESTRTFGWTNGAATTGTLDTIVSRKGAANWQYGGPDAASPVAQKISFQSVVAGNTNTAAVSTTIIGSLSNGSGGGGDIIFQTTASVASSGVQNSPVTALTIKGGTQAIQLAEATNFVFGTTTGTKIGTATSQKLAFYNATPIVQPSGDLATGLESLGLVATSSTLAASRLTSGTLGAGVGFSATTYDNGTVSTGTLTPASTNGNFQKMNNNGAHTLAPPSTICQICLEVTNGASAGAITTSGFSKVTGDTYATTSSNVYQFFITKTANKSTLNIVACQ